MGDQGQKWRRFPAPRRQARRRGSAGEGAEVLPRRRCEEATRQQKEPQAHQAQVFVRFIGRIRFLCNALCIYPLDCFSGLVLLQGRC